MIGVIRVIGVVNLVILAEIHLVYEPAFSEGGRVRYTVARHGGIFFFRPFEQLLGSEVLVSPKNRVYDSTTLSSYPEVSSRLRNFLLAAILSGSPPSVLSIKSY